VAATGDVICIHGLEVQAIIGVLPHERSTAQPVTIDLEITVDTRMAAASEKLEDTLDYAALASAVKALTIEAECLLVETLAEKIAELALQQPLARAVQVNVTKPNALQNAAGVGVRIYRAR